MSVSGPSYPVNRPSDVPCFVFNDCRRQYMYL
jgi:hypothetical protein